MNKLDTSVNIGNNIILKNPILTASGTFGYGFEFENFFDLNKIGGIVTKAITPEVRPGNAIPRIAETECGMLNSIGLANIGLERFLKELVPKIEKLNTTVFVNVAGKTIEDYVLVAQNLANLDCVAGIEVNISCPNVKEGGNSFGADPQVAAKVTKEIRKVYQKHMMVKLSPNVTDITQIAKVVEAEGADSLSLINTLFGMAIDTRTFKSKIKNKVAGYSGPAIKPIAIANTYKCSKAVKIPLIGMGGISNYLDVVEFMLAGATAVQIGTSNFSDPMIAAKLAAELENFLREKNISDIKELIGGMIDD